jgi:quinol monooxygenase YgiN
VVIVLGHVDVKPGRLDEALALSRAHVLRSRAEPGCLAHAVHHDADDPARLIFVEKWADRGALAAHFAVPEARAFARVLGELSTARPEMALFDAEPFSV